MWKQKKLWHAKLCADLIKLQNGVRKNEGSWLLPFWFTYVKFSLLILILRFINFDSDIYLVSFECIDYNENDENDSFLSICAIENNLPIFKKRRHCTNRSTPLRVVEKNKLVVFRHWWCVVAWRTQNTLIRCVSTCSVGSNLEN